jgi:hypothetical protein
VSGARKAIRNRLLATRSSLRALKNEPEKHYNFVYERAEYNHDLHPAYSDCSRKRGSAIGGRAGSARSFLARFVLTVGSGATSGPHAAVALAPDQQARENAWL